MKAIVTFAAVMCFMTLPALRADEGQLSQSSLSRLGLSGMAPISDDEGLEIRGTGLMQAMGMDNGYGDNQNKNDMHENKDHNKDHNKNKDHKNHEKEHQKNHEHNKNHEHQHNHQMNNHEHQKCDFGAKCHINFGGLCSHIHSGKG
jgi:hypothetical protein